jgi:Cu/Ag efflux protein CusF
MSRYSTYTKVAFALLASTPLWAQAQQPAQSSAARPVAGSAASASAYFTVEAINQETREVTLKKEDGTVETFVVSEEARNLAQVKKGDLVVVTYEVGLVVALGPPGSAPARVENTEASRTPLGAKPGGVVRKTVAVTATVVGIEPSTRTVTLKGPRQTVELEVADSVDLSKVKVGDQVGAVYEEALALFVQPAPDQKK